MKAASTLVNCGCQCSRFAFSFILMLDMLSQNFQFPLFGGCKTFSSLTFLDSGGQVQGNCLTVDSTGARWCYTSHGSTCQVGEINALFRTSLGSTGHKSATSSPSLDNPTFTQDLTSSARFPANPWSYEACSTPPIGSYECPNNIVAPSLVSNNIRANLFTEQTLKLLDSLQYLFAPPPPAQNTN